MSAVATQISLITACFNRRAQIGYCLRSIEEQDHPHIEHVVIDGGSTDGTLDVLAASQHRVDRLVSEPDSGIYDALNKGLRLATGDVVGFLHSDDVFAADDVLSSVAAAFEDPSIYGVYGDLEYVDRDNPDRCIRYWQAGLCGPSGLQNGWMPPHPTLFVRRSVYEAIGEFQTEYRIAADYLSILRIFRLPGFRVRYLPRVITRMRTGGASNASFRAILQKSREDWQILRETGVGGISTLLLKNARKISQLFSHRSGARHH